MKFLVITFIGLLTFHPNSKETLEVVNGNNNKVEITTDDTYRYIKSNGIPSHETGDFPNRNNPNRISVQNHEFKVTLAPVIAKKTTTLNLGIFGIAINGIPFEPNAAEWYNRDRQSGWQVEPLSGYMNLGFDEQHAHVQPTGKYHYHGIPNAILKEDGINHSALMGWAADGFPIYGTLGYNDPMDINSGVKVLSSSYRVKEGKRNGGPSGDYDGSFVQDFEYVDGRGDLDECNGRFTITPEYPNGTYAYFLTTYHPYIPRCWKGTPDKSFLQSAGMNGRPPHPSHGQGRSGPPPRQF